MTAGSKLAVACVLALATSAHAQPTTASEASTIAGTQFDNARAYMKAGKFAEACAAFEQSQRLDPQLGTLYNLAGCYVQLGKLVSAWSAYRDLSQRDTNPGRRGDAAKHVRELTPRLSKLVIKVDPPVAGVTVTSNGVDVTPLVGVETPIDLGDYAIVARAPGYEDLKLTAKVKDEGKVATIVIALVAIHQVEVPDKPTPPPPPVQHAAPIEQPEPAQPEAPPHSMRRTTAVIVAAGGGALIAGGLVVGRLASTKWNAAKAVCGADYVCDTAPELASAQQLSDAARLRANISTGLIGGGIAAIGVGAILWFTAPSESSTSTALQITPHVDPSHVGLSLAGRF